MQTYTTALPHFVLTTFLTIPSICSHAVDSPLASTFPLAPCPPPRPDCDRSTRRRGTLADPVCAAAHTRATGCAVLATHRRPGLLLRPRIQMQPALGMRTCRTARSTATEQRRQPTRSPGARTAPCSASYAAERRSAPAMRPGALGWCRGQRAAERMRRPQAATARSPDEAGPSTAGGGAGDGVYSLEETRALVETAMLAAVSGLSYLVAALLKLETGLGYFLPLPITVAAMRSGGAAGWKTMTATCFLLVVLLGPLRAASYMLMHGLLAATLGSLWHARSSFYLAIGVGAAVRMFGQMAYIVLSSVTMNENLFSLMLSNVYSMIDQVYAAVGLAGAPSNTLIVCMIFSMLLVNGLTYSFLLNIVYRVILGSMGHTMGPLPGPINRMLYGKTGDPLADATASRAAGSSRG